MPVLAAVSGTGGAELGVWRFLLISIALFSFAYGIKGGLAAACFSVCLSAIWHFSTDLDTVSEAAVLMRSLNYLLAGAIVGWLVDSRTRALSALARHVEQSSDVIVSGANGCLEEVNPAFTRVLGHPVADVVGRPYVEFVHPDDLERSLAAESEVVSGRGPIATFENRYRHLDASYRWLEWSINVVSARQKGFAVGRDVTARKQAEQRERTALADLREALRNEEELEQQLTGVIETMLDGLIKIDTARSIVFLNRAAEEMFGYSRGEVLGRDVGVLMPDHDAHGGYLDHFRKTGEASAIGLVREVAGRRKDGSVFPLDLSINETTFEGEKAFVGVIRDITGRKQAEEKERHYRETLELAVRDRTRELQEQTAALEAARLDTLQRLATAGEYHDEDTYLHTERVGKTAALIARAYGSTRDFVELIRLAAPLHDLGKLAVSDRILHKKGALTDAEWERVKTHPIVGATILAGSSSKVLQLAEEIALTHHECWDGGGYPAGLAGNDIPLSGRIVALADAFDALTHDRPYKPAWTADEAAAEIQRLSGTKFDPVIANVFRLLDLSRLADPTPTPDVAAPHIRHNSQQACAQVPAGTGNAA